MTPAEFVEHLLQHRFADDQLTHEVEQVIDALGVHPQNIFGLGDGSVLVFTVGFRSRRLAGLRMLPLRFRFADGGGDADGGDGGDEVERVGAGGGGAAE